MARKTDGSQRIPVHPALQNLVGGRDGPANSPAASNAGRITAVCRNELEVLTFDREESFRRRELVPKNRFEAPAGRVGYIYEPCIHQPKNITTNWSLSLHVSSPRDGEPPDDGGGPWPGADFVSKVPSTQDNHPYRRVMIARRRQDYVRALAGFLAQMHVPEVPQLLARCSALASSATQRMIDRLGQRADRSAAPESKWVLARVHKALILSHRDEGDMVALDVETEKGPLEEFAISSLARDAIAFVTREPLFEVSALPGNLSEEERFMIANALEEAGLFRRVRQ